MRNTDQGSELNSREYIGKSRIFQRKTQLSYGLSFDIKHILGMFE